MKLFLRLDIPYENEVYHIVAHANGGELQTANIVNNECMLKLPPVCWTFYILLYATIDERVCTYVASAEYTNLLDGVAPLKNFFGTTIGQVTLEGGMRKLAMRPYIDKSISERMINQEFAVYAIPGKFDPVRQVFYSIKTLYGNFPLAVLPLYTTMVSVTPESVKWLEQCFKTAMSIHGVDELETADLDVAGTAMTLLLQTMEYEVDYARGDVSRIPSDQWMNILQSPQLKKTGFDCEDGMLFIMTMFHAICTCNSEKSPHVKYFANLLRDYTIGAALCEIREGSIYVGHAVPVLIDKKQLRSRLKGKPYTSTLPPLVIESTAWQTSIWELRHVEDYRYIVDRVDESARVLVPASVRMVDGTYGRVCKIQFPAFDDTCLSITITDEKDSMNVSLYDFLVNGKGKIAINSQLDALQTQKLRIELQDFPKYTLPKPVQKYKKPPVTHGYPVLFDPIKKSKFDLWIPDIIPIAEDCEIGFFTVDKYHQATYIKHLLSDAEDVVVAQRALPWSKELGCLWPDRTNPYQEDHDILDPTQLYDVNQLIESSLYQQIATS